MARLLRAGCRVREKRSGEQVILLCWDLEDRIIVDTKHGPLWIQKDTYHNVQHEDEDDFKRYHEIIGRSIHLADVLLASEKQLAVDNKGQFLMVAGTQLLESGDMDGREWEPVRAGWNLLRDDLDRHAANHPTTIAFLHSLLCT